MVTRSYKRRPAHVLAAARVEVARRFAEARECFDKGDTRMAKRRVKQARRVAMKVQLRIPEFSDRYCRACDAFLAQGQNCSIRVRQGVRIKTCRECGAVRRRRLR